MVKMVLGSSDAQASSVASLADSYSTAFNNIISAVDSLGNSDKLKGSAYTNVKTYTRSVVTPLAKGMILLADAAKADTKLLPDRYRSDVGEDDLSDDTEVLAAEIAALDATINANNTALGRMEADDPNKTTIEGAVKSDTAERDKRQKKLNKINAYDAASPSFFSDIAGLEANLNSGLSLLQSGVAGFNGTFPLPSKKQLQWADSINKDYKQYQDYQSAVAKAKKGEKLSQEEAKAVEVYKKKHPGLDIDKSVTKAADKKMDEVKAKASAKELSKETGMSYEDAYNFIVNGVLSDENKGKIKLVKNTAKYAKGGLYISSSFRYWLKHKDKWTDEMFKARTFSKGGAQIEDVKYAGKYLKKSKKLKTITSKLASYEHGRLNRDLKMMKENQIPARLGKIGKWAGKGLKAAGWLGTAIDAKDAVQDYKKKGYSNEQTAALATRKVAVDMTASAVGSNVGRVAGAWVGQMIIPIPGVGAAIGSVAGSILGGIIGSKVGDAVNAQLDKGVKPKKSGWSWPW
ncbi:hypothetical protein SMU102_04345 [Streptococcus mutans S1B]|uniref:hypothetical protein n=1 Tax=Streptococcus mutans TaxID=1309 RepID=UPI0002B4FF32|nr:hypothetical protein [Streptococcus mutans]EMC50966.1 hypothetical protein SMU102_04345 [Streptococcus mutans S1B]